MDWTADRTTARTHLAGFVPRAGRAYASTRNADTGPERRNVSQLSPWLHAGLIGEDEVLRDVLAAHSASASEKFVSEVFWRIYFKGYLEQRPSIWQAYAAQRDAGLADLEANTGLAKAHTEACEGRTDIAAFDHWARELVQTGYLHNHARMWFASIWIFTLKLDWTLGADFFLRHLMDADAASNTLSWRWVGGLHTRGKTYLARASNIARYTADHPQGPLAAEGLANDAPALTEAEEHPRQALSLPPEPTPMDFAEPYALLLHNEAAHHAPVDLPRPPALVICAARPEARSPGAIGTPAKAFATGAIESGMADAAAAFACPTQLWSADRPIADILAQAGLHRLATGHLPTGWTRDALWPELGALSDKGALVELLPAIERLTWPYAKAGFFGVKKVMGQIIAKTGLNEDPRAPRLL